MKHTESNEFEFSCVDKSTVLRKCIDKGPAAAE